MKIIYAITVVLLLFLIATGAEITFKPFHISLPRLSYAIGVILIIAGISFIENQGKRDGRILGTKDVMEILKEYTTDHKKTP